jgi:hypothetical protein
MLKTFVLCGVALLSVFMNSPRAAAAEFCMSDAELRAYLAEAGLFGLGRSAAGCLRHPAFRSAWPAKMSTLERSLQAFSDANRRVAMEPFKRAHGAGADTAFDRQMNEETANSRASAQYDERQCMLLIEAAEGLAVGGATVVNQLFVSPTFSIARRKVSSCPK